MTSAGGTLTPRQPPVGRLDVKQAFQPLTSREKLYAHYMARAAWHGARIIFNQVSPESSSVFDLILELYRSCAGDWGALAEQFSVSANSLQEFLEYAAVFLGNVGNYYGRGDQKFVPRLPKEDLQKLCQVSQTSTNLFEEVWSAVYASRPSSLGFPSDVAQSSYYPGNNPITSHEVDRISKVLERESILPENTRIRKVLNGTFTTYDVLQASVAFDDKLPCRELKDPEVHGTIRIIRGDHAEDLMRVCMYLEKAQEFAANPIQREVLHQYQTSFQTGDMEAFKTSQRLWVTDVKPTVETIFGFVEPYRDPYGTRAEFEGLVAFVDIEETNLLTRLVEISADYIRQLPWAGESSENDGKGPFEKELFVPPDFTSLKTLAYCSSIIFPGINLPNFNDIRQNVGFKNVMISNQIAAEYGKDRPAPSFIAPSEVAVYMTSEYDAFYIWVVLHELLGHGTSKLLTQESETIFNFDIHNPPISPLSGQPITSWYKPGQSWTGVFGDLATSLDECRAECVGAYLMDHEELLKMFEFNGSKMTASDTAGILTNAITFTYTLYQLLGISGLRALENYIEDGHKWGQAHSRAHFAILRVLLDAGSDFMTIDYKPSSQSLTVHVDRSKILTHGKPALGRLLLRLHIWRCTADVIACRPWFEALTKVDGIFAEWRKTVLATKMPRQILVQANTFLGEDGVVTLKEYDATVEGMVQSWAERGLGRREL
ncbi:hypothetical protein MMC11_008135 [Xylographa trunciseda]|nr:hypothetical protein [Xylographa trunciseda]